jgi:hypothetical protein
MLLRFLAPCVLAAAMLTAIPGLAFAYPAAANELADDDAIVADGEIEHEDDEQERERIRHLPFTPEDKIHLYLMPYRQDVDEDVTVDPEDLVDT